MKRIEKTKRVYCFFAGIWLLFLLAGNSSAGSLFEKYTSKSKQQLKDETLAISEKIKNKFDQASVEDAQQKIDYYDYFSNLKRLVLYGTKLANYADYEQDLKFARDNELFRGLPEDRDESSGETQKLTHKFVSEKYHKMQDNIKDEVETYEDLIMISLDSCELLAANDLSGFAASKGSMQRIRRYLEHSGDYKQYVEKRSRLASTWPALESRISRQISLWAEKGLGPGDPIVDRRITLAISSAD